MSARQPIPRSVLTRTLVVVGFLIWPACHPCDPLNDPCCGDPCCGDPCCGDPCCGDPCCGDACCGDPCCGDCSFDTTALATRVHARFSSIKDRASYNLACSPDQITLDTNAEGSIQAGGCGKAIDYRCACLGGRSSVCETSTCRADVAAKASPAERQRESW
jgi:hypothetical protein